MMRSLRHVNIDHLHVGWYQSTYFGSFINKALLDSQFNYQNSIEESIVLVYGKMAFWVNLMKYLIIKDLHISCIHAGYIIIVVFNIDSWQQPSLTERSDYSTLSYIFSRSSEN